MKWTNWLGASAVAVLTLGAIQGVPPSAVAIAGPIEMAASVSSDVPVEQVE